MRKELASLANLIAQNKFILTIEAFGRLTYKTIIYTG